MFNKFRRYLEILHTTDWFNKQTSFEEVTLGQGKLHLLPEHFVVLINTYSRL
jgi:hypothetical protein